MYNITILKGFYESEDVRNLSQKKKIQNLNNMQFETETYFVLKYQIQMKFNSTHLDFNGGDIKGSSSFWI